MITHLYRILCYEWCKAFCLILFGITHISVNAQQPAHFILGEDQFKGIQIYDIIQDKELNYLFATNDGIYYFDYYKYHRIECSQAKSLVVFNFVMDSKGVIYCNNLNNQVFRIQDRKCSVFYEITLKEASSDVSLTIDERDNLYVGTRKVIVFNNQGKVINRVSIYGYLSQPLLLGGNRVIYHIGNSNKAVVFKNGHSNMHLLKGQGGLPISQTVLRFFKFGGKTCAIDLMSRKLFNFDSRLFQLVPLGNNEAFERGVFIRTYPINGGVWIAGTMQGTSYIKDDILHHPGLPFFEDYFVSDVYQDKEGNILLGTFDKGVIVVPDLTVPDVIDDFEDDPVTSMALKSDSALYMGTSKGKLLKYESGMLQTISQNGERPIEGIYAKPSSKYLIYDDGAIRLMDKKTETSILGLRASLKDAVLIDDKRCYLATNSGVTCYSFEDHQKWEYNWIEGLRMRTYAIDYCKLYQLLYVSTSNGVFALNRQHQLRPILHKGEKIFTNDLFSYGDTLYILSKQNRLLKVTGTNVVTSVALKVNKQPVRLNKLLVHNNTIYVRSGNMLYAFSLAGEYKGNLGVQHGFISHRVLDFCISGTVLWVSHTGGLQQINLTIDRGETSRPKTVISGITVNETSLQNRSNNAFLSNQRKIRFQITSPSLRNRGIINFQYKLVGYDNTWISTGPESNEVVYNALDPGSYTFMVRAENHGYLGNVTTFAFSIATPLYKQWWFIGIWIVSFILLVLYVYKRQMAIQQKRANFQNELNSLKLTAIQSQMNPHFIFNSLNAIQDLVLKGDVDNSYTFITRFSDLVRRTLTYSEKDYIDFEQEIRLLELYLSLEKLRFKDQLQYTIDTNSVEDIMIPPMLIQPFIENALIHGLLHKEGLKTIHIEFELNQMLICKITDNGVGRKRSEEIKARQRSTHESFSGSAIKRRFDILSQHNSEKLGYEYVDLYDKQQPAGTTVIIRIPVKYKF